MKKRRLKGFTLVELIIVMATFSIVLFGALQLMGPVEKLMRRSYRQEAVSAAQLSMKQYLEGQLRYVKYVQFDTALRDSSNDPITGEPTDAEIKANMVAFLQQYYNGKVDKDGAVLTDQKAYLMCIDNTQNGKITSWELTYTTGDTRGNDPDNTAVITGMTKSEWAVNKAFYDENSYLFSLGAVNLQDREFEDQPEKIRVLAVNQDYLNKITDSSVRGFGPSNATFTITPYKGNYSDIATFTDGDGNTWLRFDDASTVGANANVNMYNTTRVENSFHYNWKEVTTAEGTTTKRHVQNTENYINVDEGHEDGGFKLASGDKLYYDNLNQGSSAFTNNITEAQMLHPDRIYIMYTYPDGSDIA